MKIRQEETNKWNKAKQQVTQDPNYLYRMELTLANNLKDPIYKLFNSKRKNRVSDFMRNLAWENTISNWQKLWHIYQTIFSKHQDIWIFARKGSV